MRVADARVRIAELKHLNAFISMTSEAGEGPVVAVKDLADVRGTVTTGGGTILPAEAAERDAPVVSRMREFGCVVVGKANLHEWAFGVTSSNPHYGPVRNPHDPERIPGGSSGGSAVAVATGMCDWALGSDTGGSIRIPAALCGVVGFKPSIGSTDTEQVVPLSRSLDTLGPLAPDVESVARALEMMSGLSALLPERRRGLGDFRLAVAKDWTGDLHPEIRTPWELVTQGLSEIRLPGLAELADAGLTILLVEAGAYHRRWLEDYPDRYGTDVLALLKAGLEVPRSDYVAALRAQARLRTDTEAALDGLDALLVPTTRIPAPRIGEDYRRADLTMYTRPFNTTGHPVINLPAPAPGMPVGIQVVGHFGEEARLVEVALALEAAWKDFPSGAKPG